MMSAMILMVTGVVLARMAFIVKLCIQLVMKSRWLSVGSSELPKVVSDKISDKITDEIAN
jgi:hypothetical protein